ncbi:helix-turn-helix transcriptional regulator [Mucilaginibacter sp.]|uniref:helix-turn-helix transcriptional regulator n=1 Tax=Mucilaginibacter sp. TaxID=1882438 RepID=UPI0035BC3C97
MAPKKVATIAAAILIYLWLVKKKDSIPVNSMIDNAGGISVERFAVRDLGEIMLEDAHQSHRHDSHSFFLLETGEVAIEIDFQKFLIQSPAVLYLHPDQVHKPSARDDVQISSLSITNENLHAEYLEMLEGLTPAAPLPLNEDAYLLLKETISLCLKLTERKHAPLYQHTLKESCNTFIGLVISQYLATKKGPDRASRYEVVTKEFRKLLEQSYPTAKRPADYAKWLNVTVAYLNECVKGATGFSVSHHIQQRVVLEAKRLLYHSDKSVKEIAFALGYDDYPYFSRIFNKLTGLTALAFRSKNRD